MTHTAQHEAYEKLLNFIDKPTSVSEWFEVTQERINAFADVAMDHQWIHVDAARAQSGPFGDTIAHGYLTLSIMGHLPLAAEMLSKRLAGQKLGINYGLNRVRFPAPVVVGSCIRSVTTLKTVQIKGEMIETISEVVVGIKDSPKPACVAEIVRRLVF